MAEARWSHLFVCRGPDCASRGAQDVYTALAWEVERRGLGERVVQVQCGCVGPVCGAGPVACSYPSGVWYGGLTSADVGEIVREDLAQGRAVERLVVGRLDAP